MEQEEKRDGVESIPPTPGEPPHEPALPQEDPKIAELIERNAELERQNAELERRIAELTPRPDGDGTHEPVERNWYLRKFHRP